jgi:hypothetical protein
MEKSDRIAKVQENLRRVQVSLVELLRVLDVETFSVSFGNNWK